MMWSWLCMEGSIVHIQVLESSGMARGEMQFQYGGSGLSAAMRCSDSINTDYHEKVQTTVSRMVVTRRDAMQSHFNMST